MPAGAQTWDASGNITLDTNFLTVRDSNLLAVDNITSTGDILVSATIPPDAIVVVKDNASGLNTPGLPDVTIDYINNKIVVSNSRGSFDIGLRILQLQ